MFRLAEALGKIADLVSLAKQILDRVLGSGEHYLCGVDSEPCCHFQRQGCGVRLPYHDCIMPRLLRPTYSIQKRLCLYHL